LAGFSDVEVARPGSDSSSQFPGESIPAIRSLDIPDDYDFMDSELVELIKTAVEHELVESQ